MPFHAHAQPSEARGEASALSTLSGESQSPQRGQAGAGFPFPILQASYVSGQHEAEKAGYLKLCAGYLTQHTELLHVVTGLSQKAQEEGVCRAGTYT